MIDSRGREAKDGRTGSAPAELRRLLRKREGTAKSELQKRNLLGFTKSWVGDKEEGQLRERAERNFKPLGTVVKVVVVISWDRVPIIRSKKGFSAEEGILSRLGCQYPVSVGCSCGQLKARIQEQLGSEIRFVRVLCFGSVNKQKEGSLKPREG